MVNDLSEYRWSSFGSHGDGHEDPLLGTFPE
jgi:hypothetical protein